MSSLLSFRSANSPLPADDEDGEHSSSTPKERTKWQRQHKGEWWKKRTGYDWGKEHPEALAELRKEHNWWHAAKVWWKFNKIWQQDHQVKKTQRLSRLWEPSSESSRKTSIPMTAWTTCTSTTLCLMNMAMTLVSSTRSFWTRPWS